MTAAGPLLLGVRHHGPGSARAVRAALDAAKPAAVLIEGPPEGDALLPLAADPSMSPPVALLAHAVDDPGRASFWPMAEFSPEWVALRWALDHGAAVRFIDLPAAHTLAMAQDPTWTDGEGEEVDGGEPGEAGDRRHGLRIDPLAVLARTAGYDDPERWWEDVVEHRSTGADPHGPPPDTAPGAAPGTAPSAAVGTAPGAALDTASDAAPEAASRPAPGAPAPGAGPDIAPGAASRQAPGGPGQGDRTPGHSAHGDRAPGAGPDIAPGAAFRQAPDGAGQGDRAPGHSDPGPRAPGERDSDEPGSGHGPAHDPLAVFAGLADAMAALRETHGHGGHERDLVREAYMRLQLRAARKEHGDAVAVVCGAWHVPALAAKTTVTADRALLKGLPKVKTEITWVPWTHRRLARRSGYGAGIDSPGWYGHLFAAPDRPVERWMTKVAGLLREEDRPVSTAHVIEAVRLAGTLAALRGRPLAGLTETVDAIRAVMCDGSDVPLDLIRDRLIIGDVLGEVPDTAPAVPLQRDLTRLQRTLRLKPEASERDLDLDLRKDTDAAKSRLLHRLRLLGIGWGEPAAERAGTGTFREGWRLRWEPELHVRVAEAGVWGTTVHTAATARAEADALAATALAEVTALAERCLLAGLSEALPVVMRALADRAALDADVGHLAQALPALARSLRYGDVRSTDTAALAEVAGGLAARICVGLPPACTALDADGAAEMRGHLDAVHTAIRLLPEAADPAEDLPARWAGVLGRLAGRDRVPGVLRGRAARLLLDDGRLGEDEAARLMGLALSPGTPPAEAAAWIEGFVGGGEGNPGGGMLLVHDERLLGLVDAWLTGVPAEAFTDVLPLLRRTFGAYEPGVRRTLGELVRRGPSGTAPGGGEGWPPGFAAERDERRADAVLPLLSLLLGDDPGTAGTGTADTGTVATGTVATGTIGTGPAGTGAAGGSTGTGPADIGTVATGTTGTGPAGAGAAGGSTGSGTSTGDDTGTSTGDGTGTSAGDDTGTGHDDLVGAGR
ncbi:DUF5682 family protein [Streptomyces sp. NPDC015131]|uniref:DUF5682 family protein n=1 Tax=Streptomyces sp. NPDC015131 TaxID=3364941 RepID=UPI0036FE8194